MIFFRGYAANQLVCVQHEDDSRDFLILDDLLGKKLGVLANTGVEDQARGALGKFVLSFANIDQAFKQLAEKKMDAPSVGGLGCSDGRGLGAAFV